MWNTNFNRLKITEICWIKTFYLVCMSLRTWEHSNLWGIHWHNIEFCITMLGHAKYNFRFLVRKKIFFYISPFQPTLNFEPQPPFILLYSPSPWRINFTWTNLNLFCPRIIHAKFSSIRFSRIAEEDKNVNSLQTDDGRLPSDDNSSHDPLELKTSNPKLLSNRKHFIIFPKTIKKRYVSTNPLNNLPILIITMYKI